MDFLIVPKISPKVIGGVLLIVGTSIGGGMLALPVANSSVGFIGSSFFLFLCWLVMTAGALLMLEVNLRLPAGSNMISMATSTLGKPGKLLAWVTYLFFLYTLLSAYISGGSDVFLSLLHQAGLELPDWLATILFTSIFGLIVYSGIQAVDYVNRGLMLGKLSIYLLLVLLIAPHISVHRLAGGQTTAISGSLMILITSFGFASIVPSLRTYFEEDIATLRKVIVIGSLIPLACYILWDAVIMGTVGRQGAHGLIALINAEHTTSGLTLALQDAIHNSLITGFFAFFTSICMLTAFLGVSLGLFDFISDGFNLEKKGAQGKLNLSLTFLPPLAIVLLQPGIYLKALNYAGICCVVLLLLLPAVMAWRGRYHFKQSHAYEVVGGKVTLVLISSLSVGLLIFACQQL